MDNQDHQNYHDIESFTKAMLSEKVFACAICKNLLVVPVMIVEGIGNVCHHCSEKKDEEDEWNVVSNTQLSVLIKALNFPCKFQTDGCARVIFYETLKEHEVQCVYRPVQCLVPNDDCEWEGRLIDLFKHFKEEHSKHVLNSPFEEFSFDINITKSTTLIKLLNHNNRTYVLKIKESEDMNHFVHYIEEIETTKDDSEMVIKYVGKSGQHKVPIKRSSFGSSCDEINGKKVLLSTLEEIAESDGNLKVVIKRKKDEEKNITAELLKHLECPVCKELMRPPICQCITGHSYCNSCRQRLTECPACREGWGTGKIRNFALEGLTPSVHYPCDNAPFGCLATFLGGEIDKHGPTCEYRMYSCPIDDCNFTGSYMLCKNHFTANHKEDLIEGRVYNSSFVSRSSTTKHVKYFFEYDNIYRLTFNRLTSSCSWCIQILNIYDDTVKYFYTITITNARIKHRQTSKSNVCVNGDASLTDNNNLITFTYDDLNIYQNTTNNDEINYCCELFKESRD